MWQDTVPSWNWRRRVTTRTVHQDKTDTSVHKLTYKFSYRSSMHRLYYYRNKGGSRNSNNNAGRMVTWLMFNFLNLTTQIWGQVGIHMTTWDNNLIIEWGNLATGVLLPHPLLYTVTVHHLKLVGLSLWVRREMLPLMQPIKTPMCYNGFHLYTQILICMMFTYVLYLITLHSSLLLLFSLYI